MTLVVNPNATTVNDDLRTFVVAALEADHDLSLVATQRRGHGIELAASAAESGAQVVVALGGDGAANEAANGVAGTATALAALPAGSTNVFSRTVGFDSDPRRATVQLVDALKSFSRRRLALGMAQWTGGGDRRFLFHAGLGFDAEVIERVESNPGLKRRIGQGAFLLATAQAWFGQKTRRSSRFSARTHDVAGGVRECRGAFAICMLTDPYTYLGPLPLRVLSVADGEMERGFSLVVFDDIRALTLLGAGAAALSGRRALAELPGIEVYPGLESVTVVGEAPLHYQLDGEHLGTAGQIHLRHEPEGLEVVVPSAPPPSEL